MNTKPVLMINVRQDSLPWAFVVAGRPMAKGVAMSFHDCAQVQKFLSAEGVWIDEGYRTEEVRAAAKEHGWLCIKGSHKSYGPWDIINEMTQP